MMTQHNWDLVSYWIWGAIGLIVIRQVWESLRPVKGRGLKILLGDIHMAAAIPWIVMIFEKRGSLMDLLLPVMVGILCALPQIISTKFIKGSDGSIRFSRNVYFYLAVIMIPLLRFVMRKYLFNHHPIFISGSHYPDIELMVAIYVTLIVVNIFVWRIGSFVKFRQVVKKASRSLENSGQVTARQAALNIEANNEGMDKNESSSY
jgi:hypothetical protein